MGVRKERGLVKRKSIFEFNVELKEKAKELAKSHVDVKPIKYILKK
jgi:hypothetical protein